MICEEKFYMCSTGPRLFYLARIFCFYFITLTILDTKFNYFFILYIYILNDLYRNDPAICDGIIRSGSTIQFRIIIYKKNKKSVVRACISLFIYNSYLYFIKLIKVLNSRSREWVNVCKKNLNYHCFRTNPPEINCSFFYYQVLNFRKIFKVFRMLQYLQQNINSYWKMWCFKSSPWNYSSYK